MEMFQVLIGILTIFIFITITYLTFYVSSPYRYSNNKYSPYAKEKGKKVSSPYRYSNNGYINNLSFYPNSLFQVLIGILTIPPDRVPGTTTRSVSSPYRYSNNANFMLFVNVSNDCFKSL